MGIVADPRPAPDGSSLDTAIGRGNGATGNTAALTTRDPEPDLLLDGPAMPHGPPRRRRGKLLGPLEPGRSRGLLLALPGAGAGRRTPFTAAPAWIPIAFFVLAYVAGGTFATITALRDLFLERTVSVDFLMITAAIGAAIVGHWKRARSCSDSSPPPTRSSTTRLAAPSGR